MSQTFRNNGAIGALLDEYEKTIRELQHTITHITTTELTTIVDPDTKDPDCHSIQTILTHVVRSGYGYVDEIRQALGEQIERQITPTQPTCADYQTALLDMFAYNEQLFRDYPNLSITAFSHPNKIVVKWGNHYDLEQLLEHAIVHVLRHRRQIERFLMVLRQD